jgi:alpha-tubulin suppressor-like RCC1 family protein
MDHIKVIDVSAGNQHSACISSNRELYIWGTECFGEFLIPHLVKTVKGRVMKVSLGKNFGTVLTEKGDVYVWGSNNTGQLGLGDLVDRPTPSKLTTLKNKSISSVSAGSTFVIALGETIRAKNSNSKSNKNAKK